MSRDDAKPVPGHYTGPPMDLRSLGVRSLSVHCEACHHQTVMNVDSYPDDTPVPSSGSRMVCSRCGMVGADVRPDWNERRSAGTGRR